MASTRGQGKYYQKKGDKLRLTKNTLIKGVGGLISYRRIEVCILWELD